MRQQRGFKRRFDAWWLQEWRVWLADVPNLRSRKHKRYGCCREYAKGSSFAALLVSDNLCLLTPLPVALP